MEVFDEDQVFPDDNGQLVLKYNDWRNGIEISFLNPRFENLHFLDLSHNKISTLPSEICDLSLLKELKLGYNELSSLPEEIGTLRHLMRLHLNDNHLTNLPASIMLCCKMQEIRLEKNELKEIPIDIFGDRYNSRQFHQNLIMNITDNSDLVMIPESLRDLKHSDAVLWILNLYFDHKKMLDGICTVMLEAKKAIDRTELEIEILSRKRSELLKLKADMEFEKQIETNQIKSLVTKCKETLLLPLLKK